MKFWLRNLLILVGLLIVGVTWRRNQTAYYATFVSAPLDDGTQYTFLYPAHMRIVDSSRESVLLRYRAPISLQEKVSGWMRFGFAVKSLPMSSHDLSVHVSSQTKPFKNSREVEDWTLYVDDARSRKSFYLEDQYWGSERQHQARESKTIMESFRVLSPQTPALPPK